MKALKKLNLTKHQSLTGISHANYQENVTEISYNKHILYYNINMHD